MPSTLDSCTYPPIPHKGSVPFPRSPRTARFRSYNTDSLSAFPHLWAGSESTPPAFPPRPVVLSSMSSSGFAPFTVSIALDSPEAESTDIDAVPSERSLCAWQAANRPLQSKMRLRIHATLLRRIDFTKSPLSFDDSASLLCFHPEYKHTCRNFSL